MQLLWVLDFRIPDLGNAQRQLEQQFEQRRELHTVRTIVGMTAL